MQRIELTPDQFHHQFGIWPYNGAMYTIYDPGTRQVTTEIIIIEQPSWEKAEIDWLEHLYSL